MSKTYIQPYVFFSGNCEEAIEFYKKSLGAEVVWTRQFAMMFDGTVYAFSIILAVFLAGLAMGSGAGTLSLRVLPPRAALGWSQLLVAAGIAWASYWINLVLPYQPVNLTGGGWAIACRSIQ